MPTSGLESLDYIIELAFRSMQDNLTLWGMGGLIALVVGLILAGRLVDAWKGFMRGMSTPGGPVEDMRVVVVRVEDDND